MGLRVAFDLDGTVADLSRAMHDIARRKFRKLQAPDPSAPDPDTADGADPVASDSPVERPSLRDLGLDHHDLDRLWRHVLKQRDFWTTLPEMHDGVVARIQRLADERRWDVIFITTRPAAAGRTTQVQSQEWLAAMGFRHPSVYVVKGSRGKVAAALELDAFVDDRPENCLDIVTESRARAILIWRGDPEALGAGATAHAVVVKPSIGDAVDELVQMDRAQRGGVVRSIKRLLGRP